MNADLWQWFQDVVDGVRPIRRYDGIVEVLDERQRAVGDVDVQPRAARQDRRTRS